MFLALRHGDPRGKWPPSADAIVCVSHLLLAFNSAINPVVYYGFDPHFREGFAQVFCCKKPRQEVEGAEEEEEEGRMLQTITTTHLPC